MPLLKTTPAHSTDYFLPGYSVAGLRYADVLKHCPEETDTGRRDYFGVVPSEIQLNEGVFSHPNSAVYPGFPLVSVLQNEARIRLICPCADLKNRLCSHQTQVLLNILEQPAIRLFFDKPLRINRLKEEAREYGMENEPDPDQYFELQFQQKQITVIPRIKGLIKAGTASSLVLQKQILPAPISPPSGSVANGRKRILVIQKHKYYGHLQIDLIEADVSKDGKLKNPLVTLDPLQLTLSERNLDAVRFYTAISRFQKVAGGTDPAGDMEALNWIVQNQPQLDVYIHNKSASENLTASSLVKVTLQKQRTEIRLSVFKKSPFFEMTGEIILHDKSYPIKALPLVFSYFLQVGQTLQLLTDPGLLRVLEYFRSQNEIVLIHHTQYEEFRQTVLAPLEEIIEIRYAYIIPATKRQLVEEQYDGPPEKMIYLSENQDFVYITPVLRYGRVEVPIFSKKQVYDKDANGNVFSVERNPDLEIQFTGLLLLQHPDFESQLNQPHPFYLHKSQFLDENWFPEAFERWRQEGIEVLGFRQLLGNRFNPFKGKVLVNVASGTDWFRTDLTIVYGDQKASLKQIRKAIRNRQRYVTLDDGTEGILPLDWIEKLKAWFEAGETEGDQLLIARSRFNEIRHLFGDEILSAETKAEIRNMARRFASLETTEVEVPESLQATLRDYQIQGLKWLNFLDDLNFGGCLADDMGLGKTVQILAFILSQRKKHAFNTNLVVVPTSLLFNWQAEVEKFAPSIKVFLHYGPGRPKTHQHFDEYEIVLTTYGMLLSDIGMMKQFRFNYLFLDESQAIKNPESQRYKAARLLQSRNKIVLTGTPIENNTFDVYGQFSFACPGFLGSKQHFRELYSTPIDKFKDLRRATELQEKIRPFLLRRTKKEVAKELPDKTEMVMYCEMGEEQRAIYNAQEQELRDYIDGKTDDELKKSSMHVLTGLIKLRQICNVPSLVKGDEHQGDVSSKMEVLLEQIEDKVPFHKILVFSQFVAMLDLVKKELEKRNIPFEYLTGQTKDRASKVNSFQEREDVRVFLISLKAGGTGLNLTEADYVFIVDPWWNPAVENQAIDRCYRIGQKKNVVAVRLICPHTIEEKIMKMQAAKSKLVTDLIRTEDDVFRSLSKQDLLAMLG